MELRQSDPDGNGYTLAAQSFANSHGYSIEHPDDDTDQHSNGNSNAHGYVHSHPQHNALKCPDVNSHTNGYANCNAYRTSADRHDHASHTHSYDRLSSTCLARTSRRSASGGYATL
jgi:hypothetical protein